MKEIQKKCEKLKNENKKLKQELVNFKNHIKMNMIKYSEVEQYKQEIGEQDRKKSKKFKKSISFYRLIFAL